MKYADVLQECLDLARRGGDPEKLIANYPALASQLRLDLAAAGFARRTATALPASSGSARQLFRTNLEAQRQAEAAKVSSRRGWLWPTKAFSLALGAAAIVVIAVVALSGVIVPSDTAEASFEGVVVENDGDILTVQTEDGLQRITNADSATVSSTVGSPLRLVNLEPGQLLLIRGKQVGAGELRARQIELQEQNALPPWCERFSESCVAVERAIAERAGQCARDSAACENLRLRLQAIRSGIAAREGVRQLQQSCEAGAAAACREIQQLCQSGRPACAAITEWLRTHRSR